MGIYSNLEPIAPDPIFGLTESFKQDSSPKKINLGVGVYQDASGRTPKFKCVDEAEKKLLSSDFTQGYLPIEGLKSYTAEVQKLILEPSVIARSVCEQSPGGTGALRILADFAAQNYSSAKVWVSKPTWANHKAIFNSTGLEVAEYGYYEALTKGFSLQAMLDSLGSASAGDLVILHGCAHNPTGADPSEQEWAQIVSFLNQNKLVPVVDFAYQGFAESLETDAACLKLFSAEGQAFFVASSYSKNFSLYNQRIGALTFVGESPEQAQAVNTHLKRCIRSNYSNPPSHGARIVAEVLSNPTLRASWVEEVNEMRNRMQSMREKMVEALQNGTRDFSYIVKQRGMFSYSGLTKEEVRQLRSDFSIYIVDSGRVNVAGLNDENLPYFCDSVAKVCQLAT